MRLSVSEPVFDADSSAIGFKSWIQVFFKLWSQESQKVTFWPKKAIFRLYNPYIYGGMSHQNVHHDPIFYYIEFETDSDTKKNQ